MSETKFRVCMSVPLGKRNGTMLLCQSDKTVTGRLDILGNSNSFSGTILNDEFLELTGLLHTLLSTIPYTATGSLKNGKLQLSLKTATGAYYSISGEEINQNDKVL